MTRRGRYPRFTTVRLASQFQFRQQFVLMCVGWNCFTRCRGSVRVGSELSQNWAHFYVASFNLCLTQPSAFFALYSETDSALCPVYLETAPNASVLFPIPRASNSGVVFSRTTKQTIRNSVEGDLIHSRACSVHILPEPNPLCVRLFRLKLIFPLASPPPARHQFADPPLELFTVRLRNIFKDFYCCVYWLETLQHSESSCLWTSARHFIPR
jgi:hypothetical protein